MITRLDFLSDAVFAPPKAARTFTKIPSLFSGGASRMVMETPCFGSLLPCFALSCGGRDALGVADKLSQGVQRAHDVEELYMLDCVSGDIRNIVVNVGQNQIQNQLLIQLCQEASLIPRVANMLSAVTVEGAEPRGP